MEFEFEVNEDLVAANIIELQKYSDFMDVNLANRLWEKFQDQYLFAQSNMYKFVFKNPADKSILGEVKKHKIFAKTLLKCKETLERIQNNLNEHKAEIENFLKKLMRLEPNMKPQKVYIVPLFQIVE